MAEYFAGKPSLAHPEPGKDDCPAMYLDTSVTVRRHTRHSSHDALVLAS
jgi:hypothetical protein